MCVQKNAEDNDVDGQSSVTNDTSLARVLCDESERDMLDRPSPHYEDIKLISL